MVGIYINKLVFSYNEMQLSDKKEWVIEPYKDTDKEFYMHIAKWKKPTQKGYLLYYSSCLAFWKRKNHGDIEKVSVAKDF